MTDELIKLRHLLHSQPELSGTESNTSQTIRNFLKSYPADELITELGGHGIAVVYYGSEAGSRILIRCELDALPIHETTKLPHKSNARGVSHKCGHDGHISIVAGLAKFLYENRPVKGSVILLFQPSEETGEGAERVLHDRKFEKLNPDFVFALHNLPSFDLGTVILSDTRFASASCGLAVYLKGATSHAAQPEAGRSPALAVAQLIQTLSSLPQFYTSLHETAQVTIIHVKVGEEAFGTSPGEGVVMATLRSHSQNTMDMMINKARELSRKIAEVYDLDVSTELIQPFPATVNDPQATAFIRTAAHELGMPIQELEEPFPWSEDFGSFTALYRGALFGLGAGIKQPALHHPDYDFPDQLIERGLNLFKRIIQSLLE